MIHVHYFTYVYCNLFENEYYLEVEVEAEQKICRGCNHNRNVPSD